MTQCVAAIDQGTTSTRFMIFDQEGNVLTADQNEHQQIYPKPGWLEHDALEIWRRTQEVIEGALQKANISAKDILAIGVINQRETTLLWDKNTGKPIYNAIVCQHTRTDSIINELAKNGQSVFGKIRMSCAPTGAGKKSGIRQWTENCERSYTRVGKGNTPHHRLG